ncbi:hypothetical protein, partial [Pseudoxanthomonas sp. KAs_5_3]|uniref:hypothetical protein n=1 Tax=Pseudoxanthomonas sp. KAs_5_3 TaxID=2067658 RepID=UPI000D455863
PDGRTLDLIVPTLDVGGSTELRYRVTVAPGAPTGEAINRVEVVGAANSSNVASASVRIRPLLFTDALTVIGRVSEGDCGNPDRRRRG